MKRETTLKDKDGICYPVEITYSVEHNDGNYPDDYDISIEEIRVPVVCEVPNPNGSGYWIEHTIMLPIWESTYEYYPSYGQYGLLETAAIAKVRECIEGDKAEAEERGEQE